MTMETDTSDTPRSAEQVAFTPYLSAEEQDAMYRQSVKDGGHTMSYGERAKEIVSCARTALPTDPARDEQLRSIGDLLVIWEGTIKLYEDMLAERDEIIAARGALLGVAQAKITELTAADPNAAPLPADARRGKQ